GRPISQRDNLVFYVGGVTTIRGAEQMVAAMGKLDPALNAEFALGGPVRPPKLQKHLENMPGAERTKILGKQSRDQVVENLKIAKLGLVVLLPSPNYMESFPVKIFEYMGAGLPVVASNFEFWKQFVDDIG